MRDLNKLLRPRTIAVIGGGLWAENVVNNCLALGFHGQIWPIHPGKPSIAGYPCYGSLDDLPEAPDAAFLVVNRNAAVDLVRSLSDLGAGGAICLAAGFAEAQAEDDGATELQQQLLDAAGAMPLIGPNCYGIINYLDRSALWPDQQGGSPVSSGVAIISQSSNLAMNITMQRRSLPIAYAMAIGNQAQTSMADIVRALLSDERITALGLHIESFGDLRPWQQVAQLAHELGRPVVVLKPGVCEQARTALVSHTAAIVGSDAGADSLIRRLGFVRVDSANQFLETLKLVHLFGPLRTGSISAMSCSGGDASLIADAAHRAQIEFSPLSAQQQQQLRAALGPMVAINNPLDYHTYIWRDYTAMLQTFKALISPENALNFLVLDFARFDRCDSSDWQTAAAAAVAAAADRDARLAVVATLPENIPEEQSAQLVAGGVVPLLGLDEAMTALVHSFELSTAKPAELPLLIAEPSTGHSLISEAEAKAMLSAAGVAVPRLQRCANLEEVLTAADAIGYPVVLKGEGIAHKTEAGAVQLNLASPEQLRAAAETMACSSYLIEQQIDAAVAELLLSVLRDPAHGFVLTLASGGQLSELIRDSVNLLVPASATEIDTALQQLRAYKLLRGYRGGASADIDAIVQTVLALQELVVEHSASLAEIEINPLLCCHQRAVAVDALLRM